MGSKSYTEWEPTLLATFMSDVFMKQKTIRKKLDGCIIGNLHSHNEMGAFFSGTDDATLVDLATDENFYISTVVSNHTEKPFVCKLSYKDQYKKPQLASLEIETFYQPVLKWDVLAKKLRKIKADKKPTSSGGWNPKTRKWEPNKWERNNTGKTNKHLKTSKMGLSMFNDDLDDEEEFYEDQEDIKRFNKTQLATLEFLYNRKSLTKKEMAEELNTLGTDEALERITTL